MVHGAVPVEYILIYQIYEIQRSKIKQNAVSVRTAGWCTKNRYVNICIYVDSLRLLAATSPTAIELSW